ncbi:MAG: 4-hydroxy-3-methylbut-2-enyl diphosphate reductase [candidate division Zixibacteria bacterium]|nr:4-hydroxy-3-methylbut-2-enyl diphosphate reductase [candidate division Zixibacteria bacterium]
MKVIVASEAGFCYGVKRATKAAFEAAASAAGPVYTLGELIHNPQVVARLEEVGVRAARDVADVGAATVIIRSHGLPPAAVEALTAQGARVLDLTCPTVKAVQQRAGALAAEGYKVIIVGDRDHPEVEAIAGCAGPAAIIVNSEEEAAAVPCADKIGVVMQTTHMAAACLRIVAALLDKAPEVRIFNTLCDATARSQKAALRLAAEVDVMVVVGGRNSANTGRLAEICRASGAETHHVETASELRAEWLEGVAAVGVTAGTSTPDWLIEEVVAKLSAWSAESDDVARRRRTRSHN